ncbi:MAG: HlyD family efflux transporter periplasmic adaptor subunit [Hyphomicrobiaceae bacterium]
MSDLFRREAVQHATRRLEGVVVVATPLSLKTLGLFLAAIIFAATGFAAWATYSRKAAVTGFLVPDQGMIRATSAAAGTLQSILVREGTMVKSGDHIAVLGLSAETTAGNVGTVVFQGLEAESRAARVKAESRLAQLEVEREQASKRQTKAEAELKQAETQISLQKQRVDIARTELERGMEVAKKGYMSRREVNSRHTTLLSAEQELATLERQKATIERDIADILARLASIPLEINAARSEAISAEATITQRRAESEARRLQFITAPLGGRVAALPVTAGQSIGAGTTIAIIIPTGGRIEAELLAPSRAIGFVRPGQEVALSLQAFPYQRFGTVPGTVRTVSSTVINPNEVQLQGLNIQEPVFRIRVTLSRESLEAYSQTIPFQPGMLVSAEIVFDRRSLLEWLFDPIYAVGRRA